MSRGGLHRILLLCIQSNYPGNSGITITIRGYRLPQVPAVNARFSLGLYPERGCTRVPGYPGTR
eukprot:2740397-Rhodomonas_salina.1